MKKEFVERLLKNPDNAALSQISIYADEIDNEILEYSLFAHARCLILPKYTVVLIERLIESFYSNDIEHPENIDQQKVMENYYTIPDKIHASMRADLNIDALNVSLYKRTKIS